MRLGDNIRELLEKNDMTQKQLAEALAITPAALGNYIHNIREPDYNTLIRIADYFDISVDFLLSHHIPSSSITQEEKQLLDIFRALTFEQKEIYIEQGRLFINQNNKKTSSHSTAEKKNKCNVS